MSQLRDDVTGPQLSQDRSILKDDGCLVRQGDQHADALIASKQGEKHNLRPDWLEEGRC